MKEWTAIAYISCYLVILILTWLLNIFLTIGICTSRQFFSCKSKKIPSISKNGTSARCAQLANYYFITSICLSNIISVSLNPPSFIILNWFCKNFLFLFQLTDNINCQFISFVNSQRRPRSGRNS